MCRLHVPCLEKQVLITNFRHLVISEKLFKFSYADELKYFGVKANTSTRAANRKMTSLVTVAQESIQF